MFVEKLWLVGAEVNLEARTKKKKECYLLPRSSVQKIPLFPLLTRHFAISHHEICHVSLEMYLCGSKMAKETGHCTSERADKAVHCNPLQV